MLTTAHPIFEHVPASFADPVGLADQQAQGVVSLIVVRYDSVSASGDDQDTLGHSVLGPTYDAFVASSGQLLAVARTTPDYRFPVTPAAALTRFITHRDAGHAAFLSLFELAEDECARFLETVFYSECLKLHVEGTDSAGLVARQMARSGCSSGVLEVNDFSDPTRPRVSLIDLAEATDLTAVLARHLDGVTGRVLLYDREKNRATLPDRAGRAFDLDGVIEQANRLADARRGSEAPRGASGEPVSRNVPHVAVEACPAGDSTPDDQADAVEDYLRARADRPRLVEPTHPHATGLGALVAELQGGSPATPPALLSSPLRHGETVGLGEMDTLPPAPSPGPATADAAPPVLCEVSHGPDEASPPLASTPPTPEADACPGLRSGGASTIATLPSPPPAPATRAPVTAHTHTRHPLATELDRLRTEVFALFEDAVGRDRAVAHEAHILDETGIASPVASADTVRYLRALLCDEPPRRWHFFKRGRAKTYPEVAGKLLAFLAANGHLDDPVVHEVTKLWTRLHK